MPVQVTCRNLELPKGLGEIVEKKSRKLKRFFDKVDRIEVIFTAEKFRRRCEIIVHAGPFNCTAIVENGNEGSAFDKALKSVERQIKDYKTRMIHLKRKHEGTGRLMAREESATELEATAEAV